MIPRMQRLSVLAVLAGLVAFTVAQEKPGPITDPAKVDADYAVQGEYVGTVAESGQPQKYGVQVVATGAGRFRAVAHRGGLPGDGWDKGKKLEADGQTKDGLTSFPKLFGGGSIKDGTLTVLGSDGKPVGELKRIERQSPTLGAKPPPGAIILFDGTDTTHFPKAKMTEDRLLTVPATTRDSYKDFLLHLEFRVPYRDGGNSGVYLQGTYEIQVLNSYGRNIGKGDCGAIYSTRVPDVNMSLPPLVWQTFDIDYTAARFDDDKVVQNPVVTVRHNGVVIHDKVELPDKPTGGGRPLSPKGGPLHLQSHGSPVVYRNLWIVEKK
jgi:hypothetical protein